MAKRLLLLYISQYSGHHYASLAIEKAVSILAPDTQMMNINAFNYTNPIMEKVINRTYLGVIKKRPEIWEYLYDNPKVLRMVKGLREAIHRHNSPKLKKLIDEFRPNMIICTQAFPCGMVADHKRYDSLSVPLMAVLTDYAPHSYWLYNNVDFYVVPCENTGRRLVENGIDPEKVKPFGIPVNPRFNHPIDRSAILERLGFSETVPVVLIMGGTQGLGLIRESVMALEKLEHRIQSIIVTGTNKNLFAWLEKRKSLLKNRTRVYGFVDNIEELMSVSDLIVTKPGGMTTAEALCKGLPILIVNPLPGQEMMNTNVLLREEVAIRAHNHTDVALIIEELLENRDKMSYMSQKAGAISRPDSALNIARLALEAAR